jgi:acetyltransferase-like isoleucine patch superfamily enzyme
MAVERAMADTVLDLQSQPQGAVVVEGPRNVLRIGRNVTCNLTIHIAGSGCVVEIGDDCHLTGIIRIVRGEGGVIRIGRHTTFNGVGLSMHEAGEIHIGDDCMFSADIHMDVSDMHPIYDRNTGSRINPARSISIGDHVWLGNRVLVTKGASIGSGTVVGAGSMVVGTLPSNVIAVGSPAKVVREDVEWRRDFDQPAPVPRPPAVADRKGWAGRLPLLSRKARRARLRGPGDEA